MDNAKSLKQLHHVSWLDSIRQLTQAVERLEGLSVEIESGKREVGIPSGPINPPYGEGGSGDSLSAFLSRDGSPVRELSDRIEKVIEAIKGNLF